MSKQTNDQAYQKDFVYTHKNPYHDRLAAFDKFVLRDLEAEEFKTKWNESVFEREAPLCVEIGSGYGHFMLEFCSNNPDVNFVGIDYRFKRSFNLAKKLEKLGAPHLRYLRAKGERLGFLFGENEIEKLFYFFPDPWPKKRHQKKRLFQTHFLDEVKRVLKTDGIMFIKTDHDDYFDHMRKVVEEHKGFEVLYETFDLWENKEILDKSSKEESFFKGFMTKFEKLFISKNINIKAMAIRPKI
ncbi:MAG: tRNA (guanosine(46)-N7)-methyltransferase TrmB [Bacteriovoracaceae bacterium]